MNKIDEIEDGVGCLMVFRHGVGDGVRDKVKDNGIKYKFEIGLDMGLEMGLPAALWVCAGSAEMASAPARLLQHCLHECHSIECMCVTVGCSYAYHTLPEIGQPHVHVAPTECWPFSCSGLR